MHYINSKEIIKKYLNYSNNIQDKLSSDSDTILYLIALIWSEKPYLAKDIPDSNNKEIKTLKDFCNIFNLILEDKLTEIPLIDFDDHFEGRHHSIVSLLTGAIHQLTVNGKLQYLLNNE